MVLLIGLLLLLATFSTKIAARLSVPGLVVFLSLGMLFGSDGLGLIHFDNPVLAQTFANICLLFILFEGGMRTKKEVLREVLVPSMLLATVGVIITALVVGLSIHWLLGLALPYALLIGAIPSSTDAAAVFALLKNKQLKGRVRGTLESESASNDPMAIILTTAMIQYIQGQLGSPGLLVLNLVLQLVIGAVVGFLTAKAAVILFNKLRLEAQSFYYVMALGVALISFGLADLVWGNGFLAVFVTGVVLGNSRFVFKRGIDLFTEGISTFCHVALFLMLGLLVYPSEAIMVWREGLIVSLVLMFVARPIAVFLTIAFNKYPLRERIFLSWAGIKGSVPIVLATYPLAAGLEQGAYIFNIVFFVVLISTILQGSTIDWSAKKTNLYIGTRQNSPHSLELISLEKSQVELMECDVGKHSPAAGKKVMDLGLPKHALVVGIVRNNDIITPRGATRIQAGDILFILVRYMDKAAVLQCLEEGGPDAAVARQTETGRNSEKALFENVV